MFALHDLRGRGGPTIGDSFGRGKALLKASIVCFLPQMESKATWRIRLDGSVAFQEEHRLSQGFRNVGVAGNRHDAGGTAEKDGFDRWTGVLPDSRFPH